METGHAMEHNAETNALEFLVSLANVIYQMTPEQRVMTLGSVASLVEAMDEFDRDLGCEVIYSPQGNKLVLTFNGAPEMPPVVVEMPSVKSRVE